MGLGDASEPPQCQDPDLTGSDLRVACDIGRSKRQQHLNHRALRWELKRGPNSDATEEGPAPYQHRGGTELQKRPRERAPHVQRYRSEQYKSTLGRVPEQQMAWSLLEVMGRSILTCY